MDRIPVKAAIEKEQLGRQVEALEQAVQEPKHQHFDAEMRLVAAEQS